MVDSYNRSQWITSLHTAISKLLRESNARTIRHFPSSVQGSVDSRFLQGGSLATTKRGVLSNRFRLNTSLLQGQPNFDVRTESGLFPCHAGTEPLPISAERRRRCNQPRWSGDHGPRPRALTDTCIRGGNLHTTGPAMTTHQSFASAPSSLPH